MQKLYLHHIVCAITWFVSIFQLKKKGAGWVPYVLQ